MYTCANVQEQPTGSDRSHAERRVQPDVKAPGLGVGARVAGGNRCVLLTHSSADRAGRRDP